MRISKNPHEVAAWREAGHTTFFLKAGWTSLSFWEQAQKFVKCFQKPSQRRSGRRMERYSWFQ
jgi:hypothetical protein